MPNTSYRDIENIGMLARQTNSMIVSGSLLLGGILLIAAGGIGQEIANRAREIAERLDRRPKDSA